jgi:hypothetical protein
MDQTIGDSGIATSSMRYHLRTLLIILALGPPVLAWIWLTANQNYGLEILASSTPILIVFVLLIAGLFALLERRRYLLDLDRRLHRRSDLFSDDWPPST